MAKDDENDVLNQEHIAYQNAKVFCQKLIKSVETYLEEKEDLKKYILWDKVKPN